MTPLVFSLLTAAAAIGFLVAERRAHGPLRWATKSLASAGFVGAALAAGALQSPFGRYLAAALAFSLAGDLLLIPESTFLLGLGAFLVGHLLFAAAFVVRGFDVRILLGAAVPALIAAVVVGRWLLPHVKEKMRAPVVAYMAAISVMVSLAAASCLRTPAPLALAGALAFYFSDLSVARDRFVAPGFVNRLWGIPLYYGAQLLFAWSVAN